MSKDTTDLRGHVRLGAEAYLGSAEFNARQSLLQTRIAACALATRRLFHSRLRLT
jgi:hypothetical protein